MNKKWKVIYYKTKDGESIVEEFINSRDVKNRLKLSSTIDYLEEVGINLHRSLGDYLKDGIHELRVKLSGDETRTLYFFCFETYIVLTHTFIKRTDKVPEKEINKAKEYRKDFFSRYNINNIKDLLI